MALKRLNDNCRVVAAGLLTVSALGGWAMSTILDSQAAGSDTLAIARKGEPPTYDEVKYSLVGSYRVTAMETDGKPYSGRRIVDVALAPSGALEIDWGNGQRVGVAQLIGNIWRSAR